MKFSISPNYSLGSVELTVRDTQFDFEVGSTSRYRIGRKHKGHEIEEHNTRKGIWADSEDAFLDIN